MASVTVSRIALTLLLCGTSIGAFGQVQPTSGAGLVQKAGSGAAKTVVVAAPAPHVAAARAKSAMHAAVKPKRLLLVMLADLGPLAAPPQSSAMLIKPLPPENTTGARAGFVAAPLPDPDVAGPNGAGPTPQLGPALLSRKVDFQGHGYSNASSEDYGVAEREQPAAGVKISLPVIQ